MAMAPMTDMRNCAPHHGLVAESGTPCCTVAPGLAPDVPQRGPRTLINTGGSGQEGVGVKMFVFSQGFFFYFVDYRGLLLHKLVPLSRELDCRMAFTISSSSVCLIVCRVLSVDFVGWLLNVPATC